MPKHSNEVSREQLVDNLHSAVRAFVEGGNGKALVIGPVEIVQHRATEFDVVIRCIGRPPQWQRLKFETAAVSKLRRRRPRSNLRNEPINKLYQLCVFDGLLDNVYARSLYEWIKRPLIKARAYDDGQTRIFQPELASHVCTAAVRKAQIYDGGDKVDAT